MAGAKLKYNGRVKGSTILEVVISMVIIIIVFGIGMMIYANVLRLSLTAKKLQAQGILQETLLASENSKDNISQSIVIDDIKIEEEVKPYNLDKSLTEIDLAAYDANQEKIAEIHKVIINK